MVFDAAKAEWVAADGGSKPGEHPRLPGAKRKRRQDFRHAKADTFKRKQCVYACGVCVRENGLCAGNCENCAVFRYFSLTSGVLVCTAETMEQIRDGKGWEVRTCVLCHHLYACAFPTMSQRATVPCTR